MKPVNNIAIVGLGTMGGELSQYMAERGERIYGVDPSPQARESASPRLLGVVDQITHLPQDLDAVIECVPETYRAKSRVWKKLGRHMSEQTFLMTVSSCFPSRVFARRVPAPERVFNAHVLPDFNVRKLVEFQTSGETDVSFINGMASKFQQLGFPTLTVNGESEGFIFNRIWHNLLGICLELAHDLEITDIDQTTMDVFGTPYGPFTAMDYVGLDTLTLVAKNSDINVPDAVTERIEKGDLGLKTGKGFYTHPKQGPLNGKSGEFIPDVAGKLMEVVDRNARDLLEEGQDRASIVKAIQAGFPSDYNPFGRNLEYKSPPERIQQEETSEEVLTNEDLQRALEEDQFALYYQPVVRLRDRRIVGVEALLRWEPQAGEIKRPRVFLNSAKRWNLMAAIGEWVLTQAGEQLREWINHQLISDPFHVSINQSLTELIHPGFVSVLENILDELELSPEHLSLDIHTKTIHRNGKVKTVLREVEALGCQIGLDDFGSGSSSLNLLTHWPVHHLKLDPVFVREPAVNAEDAESSRELVEVGQQLGLKVVAKGVESPEQHRRMTEWGCDLGQGFFYSRPRPAPEMTSLLEDSVLEGESSREPGRESETPEA